MAGRLAARQTALRCCLGSRSGGILLLIVAAAALLPHCAAQGLRRDDTAKLGSSNAYDSLSKVYSNSKAFAQAYKLNHRSACSTSSSSLCSASSSDAATLGSLTMAASPWRFDARSTTDTGGIYMASPVRDQGRCFSCTGFAIAAAAEAAVSAATRKGAGGRIYSAQDISFCGGSGGGEIRSCSSSMGMQEALRSFIDITRSRGVVMDYCLPYDAPNRPAGDDMCDYKCKDVDPDAQGGTFAYVQLPTPWEIQAHIRAWGGALSRMDLFPDTRAFFNQNPGGTYYGPPPGSKVQEAHAVLLVGYDNDNERWLVRNSWGKDFAQGGYMWVSYKATDTGVAASGDTYGLKFTPKNPPKIPYTLSPDTTNPDCNWLVPPSNWWVSTAAAQFGVPLQRVLLDNLDRITDLDRPLSSRVLLCGIPNAILQRTSVSGSTQPSTVTPAPGPTQTLTPGPAPVPVSGCDADSVPQQVQNLRSAGTKSLGGGRSEITLQFDAPNGGECIKQYDVNAVNTMGGSSTKQSFSNSARSGIIYTFQGASGTPYLFDVMAVNDAGASPSRSVTVRSAA